MSGARFVHASKQKCVQHVLRAAFGRWELCWKSMTERKPAGPPPDEVPVPAESKGASIGAECVWQWLRELCVHWVPSGAVSGIADWSVCVPSLWHRV